MAYKPQADGRTVRELNAEIDGLIAEVKRVLVDVLGSTDPLAYHRAMRRALLLLEEAHVASRDIEAICAAAANRGEYRKGSVS
jgi:hypothetical protein